MRVIAAEMGFYDGARRRPGTEFEFDEAHAKRDERGNVVLPSWMRPATASARAELGNAKRAAEKKAVAAAIASSGSAHYERKKDMLKEVMASPIPKAGA